jgi:general secretion pathway protein M
MDRLRGLVDGLKNYWENLTDRERMLLGVLGAVAGALLILLPVYLLTTSISDLEEDNERITSALRRISHSRGRLAAQQAERMAAQQRYARRAPALGTFLEAKAGELEGLTISDVQREPEREEGQFRIRHTRARFQNTGLRNAVLFLESVENSRYPVAVERIHIDHHQSGDRYNFQIGVLAFDREGAGGADAGVPRAASSDDDDGRAGPPAP